MTTDVQRVLAGHSALGSSLVEDAVDPDAAARLSGVSERVPTEGISERILQRQHESASVNEATLTATYASQTCRFHPKSDLIAIKVKNRAYIN